MKSLRIENCNALDLDSIGSLQGLTVLSIMSNQKLHSLDFLGRCPSLRELSLYATLKHTDIDELKRTKTLSRVYIQLPAKRLAEVALANPRLTISNGTDCFKAGRRGRHFGDFYPE